jgi:uroporphyrinogen decarboxylase
LIREAMTSLERWQAVFERRKPDHVPMDYWGTEEATQKLMRHLGCRTRREMLRKLRVDYEVRVRPRYVGPKPPRMTDEFGRKFRKVDYGMGAYRECIHFPLAGFRSVDEIERHYVWPSPDGWDYSSIAAQLWGNEDHPIRGGGSEPFLIYKELRGQEQAFVDLIENPEIAHYCLGKLFDLAYESTRRIYEAIPGKVHVSYVGEDFGSQQGLLFSREQIRRFLLPRMKQMMDLAHEAGAFVFTHSDGAIRPIIPDLIDIGTDILNPIQWRCADMDREALKRDFGEQLVFHGGVDNQETLAFGSADDVRQEVLDNLRILGEGGGYILAPCHNVQAVSPPENVVAMYETGYENGWT